MLKETGIKKCLNCNAQVESKFCPECGQSIETHRYVIRHVIVHDFFLNLIYYRQGFFFTIVRLFTKPGITIRDFVAGKRVSIVHPIPLLIVSIILHTLALENTSFNFSTLSSSSEESQVIHAIDDFIKTYPKLFYVGVIPLYAFFSFIFFRKAKLNYAEHLVLNAFKAVASLLISTAFILVTMVVKDIDTLKNINSLTSILLVSYNIWFYYRYFYPSYSNKFLLFTNALFCFFVPVLLMVISLALYFQHRLGI